MKRTLAELKALKGGEESTRGDRKDMSTGTSIWTLVRDIIDSMACISNITITTVTTATYTLLDSDSFLLINRAGTVAITIPTPLSGRVVRIKDSGGNASQYNITATATAVTIDGQATAVIGTDYDSISLISDGTNWFIF